MSTTEKMLPLYEGKMIHHYDHRWATFDANGESRDVTLEEKQDPDFAPLPRYWVRESLVRDKIGDLVQNETLLGFRDICRSTDERTVISTVFPLSGVGNKLPLILTNFRKKLIEANLTSFVLDFASRQKVGGTTLNFFIVQQLPLLHPKTFATVAPWDLRVECGQWILMRSDDLHSSSWDLSRRSHLRAELDAAFFHLYGITRSDVDYIMETFPIVKRKDEAAFGEFRTKRLILEIYDAMAEAMRTGTPYETVLDPPPASAEVGAAT